MFVGVDGCPKGWVSVTINTRRVVAAHLFEDFDSLVAAHAGAKCIGVDMPIGLVDAPQRLADQAARDFLKGNASSVFNAPVRSALKAKTYERAKAISLRVAKKALSRQSFGILDKIRQVDAHQSDARLYEVHPEVSFRLMNEGRLPHGKKSWGGLMARLDLLRAQGLELPARLGEADAVGIDDVVDAAAAAWSARRIARGRARSFPCPATQRDPSGRTIAIWG